FFLTKLGKIFVQQFLCFQSGKRFYNKDSDQILAYQPFKGLCHCLIAVLIISAYKKDIFCSYSKKQTGKKLKAHSIHPLDIIQKKNYLIILCDLPAHLYSNPLNTLKRRLTELFSCSRPLKNLTDLQSFLLYQRRFK